LMLLYGEGGPVDPSGAEWIQRAAAQNDLAALYYLESVTE
jgi:TPR repeat protein